MSTNYTDTLKKIKAAEEASNREVSERRRSLEAELLSLEERSDKSIADAKAAAESYVTSEGDKARSAAEKEADALLASTKKKADALSAKSLDKKQLREIVDKVLLSEFKGE